MTETQLLSKQTLQELEKHLDELEKQETLWPYPARRIRRGEEDLVRLLLAGLRDKREPYDEDGFPFVVVTDMDLIETGREGRVIRPEDPWRFYPDFCKYLQENIPGGFSLCHESTIDNVRKFHKERTELSLTACSHCIKELSCHMGLRNLYIPLIFKDRPFTIAYGAAGKFCYKEDLSVIQREIDQLMYRLPKVLPSKLEQLKEYMEKIPIKTENEVEEIKHKLFSGITSLEAILGDIHEKNRRLFYRKFRGRIEGQLYQILQKLVDTAEIPESDEVNYILRRICLYLGVQYLAIFFSDTFKGTGLELLVLQGERDVKRTDVHFNWKKGGLEGKEIVALDWDYLPKAEELKKGIKGPKREEIKDSDYMFPFELSGHYGLVVLGPFKREVDISKERELLNRLCYAIGMRIGSLAVMGTMTKKDMEKKRAVAIPAHTVKHGLANIRSSFILIGNIAERTDLNPSSVKHAVKEWISRTENAIEMLASFAVTTLESPDAMQGLTAELQKSHLQLEPLSPMVLLGQCLPLHQDRAKVEGKQIECDDLSIENLPGIYADPSILRLALDILLENAIKYSGKGNTIVIKGETVRVAEKIKIHIQNIGLEITEKEKEEIFELGKRGAAPQKYLPDKKGYGIGLSQVKKIIVMHGGQIFPQCEKRGKGPWDHLVTFTITLPTLMGSKLGL